MSTPNIRGCGQFETVRNQMVNATETVAISGTTAKNATAGLALGDYLIKSSCDCFVRQGAWASITSTAAAGFPLFAGEYLIIPVTKAGFDDGIAAITGGATGSLYIKQYEAA